MSSTTRPSTSTVSAATGADATASTTPANSTTSSELFEECPRVNKGDTVLARFQNNAHMLLGCVEKVIVHEDDTETYQVKAQGPVDSPTAGVAQEFALRDLRKPPKLLPRPDDYSEEELNKYIRSYQLSVGDYVLAKTLHAHQTSKFLPAVITMGPQGNSKAFQVQFLHDSKKQLLPRVEMLLLVEGSPVMRDRLKHPIYATEMPAPRPVTQPKIANQVKKAAKKNGFKIQKNTKVTAQLGRMRPYLDRAVTMTLFGHFNTYAGNNGDWKRLKLSKVPKGDNEETIPVTKIEDNESIRGMLDTVNTDKSMLAHFITGNSSTHMVIGQLEPHSLMVDDVASVKIAYVKDTAVFLRFEARTGEVCEFATDWSNKGSMEWCAKMMAKKMKDRARNQG